MNRNTMGIAKLLNDRPCKTLDWKTPAEAIAGELATFASNVAVGP